LARPSRTSNAIPEATTISEPANNDGVGASPHTTKPIGTAQTNSR